MSGDGPQFGRESSDDVWVRCLRDLLEGGVNEKVDEVETKEETYTGIMPVKMRRFGAVALSCALLY